jgi:hypothetical protein
MSQMARAEQSSAESTTMAPPYQMGAKGLIGQRFLEVSQKFFSFFQFLQDACVTL